MNELLEFLKENWVSITGTIGVVVAWIVDKNKRKEDFKITQNSAMEGMQNAYDKFVEDAQKQYDLLTSKISEFEAREREAIADRAKLQENLKILKQEMSNDKKKIEAMQRKITEYEVKIKTYEEQVSAYKLKVEDLTKELSLYKK